MLWTPCPRCLSLLALNRWGEPHCWTCGYVDYYYASPPLSRFQAALRVVTYYLRYRGEVPLLRNVLTVATGNRKARGKMGAGVGYYAACPFCGGVMAFNRYEGGHNSSVAKGWKQMQCLEHHRIWLDYEGGVPAGWR